MIKYLFVLDFCKCQISHLFYNIVKLFLSKTMNPFSRFRRGEVKHRLRLHFLTPIIVLASHFEQYLH